MSILDVLSGGALGQALNGMLGGNLQGMGGGIGDILGKAGNLQGMGGGIGDILNKAGNVMGDIKANAPGGLGGLLGAGAIGTILGGAMPKNMAKTVALAGAAAAAWNFFQKWSNQQKAPQAPRQTELTSNNSGWGEGNWAIEQTNETEKALPMDNDIVEMVTRAMVYAAKSDGNIDATERSRMEAVLTNLLPAGNVKETIEIIQSEPLDPERLAKAAKSPEQAEDLYRLSCAVIDVDHFMETSYLQALANSLQINPQRKKELENEAIAAKNALTRELGA